MCPYEHVQEGVLFRATDAFRVSQIYEYNTKHKIDQSQNCGHEMSFSETVGLFVCCLWNHSNIEGRFLSLVLPLADPGWSCD